MTTEIKQPLHRFYDEKSDREYYIRGDLEQMLEDGHIGNASYRDDYIGIVKED